MANHVTPWKVTGSINYDKLVKEFGVKKLTEQIIKRMEKITGEAHFMFRRNIFFAHRDFNWILDEYENGNKFFLYTGRAPSDNTTLGHLVPWTLTKWMQDKFDVELWFQFPDEEKFLFKKDLEFETVEKYLHENMLDIIALGFNPKKTHFIVDTKHADLMYKEACRVAKRITYSTVKSAFGLKDDANIGSIFYTSMQAVPAFLPSVIAGKKIPCIIPHAVDQDPHFRVTRDILPKIGHYKPASIQCVFLPPLSGVDGKMSSSGEYTIFTTDSEKMVKDKINKYAFSGGRETLEEHKEKGGNPDIDVSYQYLRMLLEDDDKKLKEIYDKYKSGEMTTRELKKYTINKINGFLKEHQRKREEARKMVDEFVYVG